MVAPLTKHEFDKLRDLIVNICGIAIDDGKDYLVETRLSSLAQELNAETFSDLHRIAVSRSEEVLPKIIDLMTTNETFWFRDDSLWNLLEEEIVPKLFALLDSMGGPVRIWSMACSTGQEPYSLSMLIEERAARINKNSAVHDFTILATDISPSALFIAKNGRYDKFAMSRGLSEAQKKKIF